MRKYHGRQSILPSEFDEYLAASDDLRRELGTILQEIRDILRGSDALTGAFGRALLLPDLRQWHALATRDVQQCCIAFVDIDQLKEINDVHGHTVGDQVLAGAIAQLTRHLRPYDRVYRYGGDEFVMSLPATELEQAEQLLVRLRDAIVGEPLVVPPAGDPIYASASFGLAMLDPEISVEEAVDRADRALLLAKSSGRNRVVSWDPGIRTGTMLAWRNEDSACK
jgi:diguanylate cyclase (GGDEF)-like protein